jgi:hypothetical protein
MSEEGNLYGKGRDFFHVYVWKTRDYECKRLKVVIVGMYGIYFRFMNSWEEKL